MVLTEITKIEQKRFDELQRQGMLPYEAMARLESERKLGILYEEEPSEKNWWFYPGLGVLGVATLYMYIRTRLSKPSTTPTPAPVTSQLSSQSSHPPLSSSHNSHIENIQKTLDKMEIEINKLTQR